MLHKVLCVYRITIWFLRILFYRRDKELCHECRFCCSLSICTNKDGTYFMDSSNSINGSANKVSLNHHSPQTAFANLVITRNSLPPLDTWWI